MQTLRIACRLFSRHIEENKLYGKLSTALKRTSELCHSIPFKIELFNRIPACLLPIDTYDMIMLKRYGKENNPNVDSRRTLKHFFNAAVKLENFNDSIVNDICSTLRGIELQKDTTDKPYRFRIDKLHLLTLILGPIILGFVGYGIQTGIDRSYLMLTILAASQIYLFLAMIHLRV